MKISNSAQRGGALLAVLWLSAALAAIALSVASSVRSETDRVSTSAEGLRAWYLATGSVERGIQWMIWGPSYRMPDGSPRFWQPGLSRMNMSFPGGDAIVEMIPESAKLNINKASPEDLFGVVAFVTEDANRARAIVDGILDWRGAAGASGSFDQYYLAISPTFRPRHASFQEIEELLLVRGMTPEIFYGNYVPDDQGRLYASGGLRDCLSVWGSNGPFDANSVGIPLMVAVGIPPDAARLIAARRAAAPFKTPGDLSALGIPTPRLSVGGNFIWTLRGTSRLRRPDGRPSDVVRTASAVVKLVDPKNFNIPVHVLRWYDDAWTQSAVAPPSGARTQ